MYYDDTSSDVNKNQKAALRENARGHAAVVIPRGEKGPNISGWQNTKPLTDGASVLNKHVDPDANIGVLTGAPSGNLIDLDLDDACTPTLANAAGLTSTSTYGRYGKKGSHRWFRIPEGQSVGRITYQDPTSKKMLGEIRGTGCQSVIPPSKHPTGVDLEWESDEDIPSIDLDDLKRQVGLVMFAAMVARRMNDGNRHNPLLHFAGAVLKAGYPEDVVTRVVRTMGELSGGDDYGDWDRLVRSTAALIEQGDAESVKGLSGIAEDFPDGRDVAGLGRKWLDMAPEDTRDVVRLDVDNVNTLADRTVKALENHNDSPSLFVDSNEELATVRIQDDGTPTIDHFNEHQARERFMRTVKFESPGKVTKDAPQPAPVERTVSLDIVRNILGRRDLPFPTLDTITTAPNFAADGSIRLTAGYDPATRAYLYPVGGVDFHTPSLDREPTQADLRGAVDLLDELIGDFPFVGNADRAHTMVGILQQAAPDLIGGFIPMLAFEKPAPGTGASLLVRTITTPFTGPNGAGSITHPKDDAEFEKTLVGLHMQGLRHAFFDNVDGLFGGPLLAEALTATHKNLRVLGTNRILQARMPTFWYLTGNNPTFTDDLPRRIVPIRLDAKIDRPWQRSGFRHRLPAWAWDNRVRIIQAVLTIWKAWLAAGRPKGTVTMGSYEPWAETMGGVLAVAGITGFLTNTDDFYDSADVEGSAWRAIVAAWWEQFGSEPVTVKDLLMLPAVSEMLGIGMSDKDRKAFGWKVRSQRDRRYGDLMIGRKGMNRDKVQTYQLIHLEGTVRARKKDDARTPFGKPGDVIDLFGARP